MVLGVIATKQTGRHSEIELLTIANLCANTGLIVLGVCCIVVRKLTWLGMLMLIVSSTLVCFESSA